MALRLHASFDEAKHPRDRRGRFMTVGEILGDLAGAFRAPLPGSAERVDCGDDVFKALRLLHQGKHVELNQPDDVATLVDKLGEWARRSEAKGLKAPSINLCGVSVKGSNLFCAESKGIPRLEMPQLAGKPLPGSRAERELKPDPRGDYDLVPAFTDFLRHNGFKVEEGSLEASHMRATQAELNGAKVAKLVGMMDAGTPIEGRMLVSRDNYIVDGHHRWAATVGVDSRDNDLENDPPIPVDRVDIDIGTLLDAARQFSADWGMPQRGADEKTARPQVQIHPRPGVKIQPPPPERSNLIRRSQLSPPGRTSLAVGARLILRGYAEDDCGCERIRLRLYAGRPFDEAKHPRGPRGTHQGGRFVSKGAILGGLEHAINEALDVHPEDFVADRKPAPAARARRKAARPLPKLGKAKVTFHYNDKKRRVEVDDAALEPVVKELEDRTGVKAVGKTPFQKFVDMVRWLLLGRRWDEEEKKWHNNGALFGLRAEVQTKLANAVVLYGRLKEGKSAPEPDEVDQFNTHITDAIDMLDRNPMLRSGLGAVANLAIQATPLSPLLQEGPHTHLAEDEDVRRIIVVARPPDTRGDETQTRRRLATRPAVRRRVVAQGDRP